MNLLRYWRTLAVGRSSACGFVYHSLAYAVLAAKLIPIYAFS
jgi:hypothetical protein